MKRLLTVALLLTLPASPAAAQLNTVLSDLLNTILQERLQLSPGEHAGHFEPAAEVAVGTLAPALNALIADNIAAFPLSATAAGVTFDFSTGQPVSIIESQGPIFAETATTLGRGRLNVGLTGTRLSLNRLRGIPLDELRFTFPHEDICPRGVETCGPGLGDNATEIDVIDVYMDLDVDATILALSATYGLLPNLDVGVAVPFVAVSIGGTARAVVDSRTMSRFGQAFHFFGCTGELGEGGCLAPVLTTEEDYDDSVAGIGDVALRAKYHFPTGADYDLGALLDVRLPTGSEEDYLGTGSVGVQLSLLGSATLGDFAPHANVGYNYRSSAVEAEGGEFDRSAVRFVVGFDQQLVPRVTLALDLLGDVNLGDDPLEALPGSVVILDSNETMDGEIGEAEREVRLTNVPADRGSSTLDASIGARFAFSERFQALGNVLVPLNDNGLRSSIVPTVGASLTF